MAQALIPGVPKTANQQATLLAPDPVLVGLNPLCGDLDDDGDVDLRDLRRIAGLVARRGYDRRADYDGDGRVDGRDLATWARCEVDFLRGRFVGPNRH
jgi:hypothetical protein